MTVRSDLPWPLRWAMLALVFGFCAAIALWAIEFDRGIAGLGRDPAHEIAELRSEVERLREERDKAQALADGAESLVKAEKTAQERLALQLRAAEASVLELKADLGFFERLLPASAAGLSVRGLHAEIKAPGQLRYQSLLMQSGRSPAEFRGRYEVLLGGTLDGRSWSQASGGRSLAVKQYARLDGVIEHPPQAVVKTVELRVSDNNGGVRVTQNVDL